MTRVLPPAIVLGFFLGFFLSLVPGFARAQIIVFTAASMAEAVGQMTQDFTQKTGIVVHVASAASSTLARQIEHGAGADIFISANTDWITYLHGLGRIDQSTPLASNRLVLIAHEAHRYLGHIDYTPATAGLEDSRVSDTTIARLADLLALLGPDRRLAMGDPAHVPAGQYAKQALQAADWWDTLVPYIAPTASVRAALALVAAGTAPVGIVYTTDAKILPDIHIIGHISNNIHPLITYPVALIDDAHDDALLFYQFAQAASAQAILRQHGFTPPHE